jgi:hypothetical protein
MNWLGLVKQADIAKGSVMANSSDWKKASVATLLVFESYAIAILKRYRVQWEEASRFD